MKSVELYAGSAETSAWLRDEGWATTTVDVDPCCRVDVVDDILGRERVRKPTHLWTNSRVLIGMFQKDMFYCTPDKPCGCANHISVRPVRGAGYRARDAAWWPVEFASLVARVLANEARSLAA